MQTPKLDDDFQKAIDAFAKDLISNKDFFVLSHHDADGITSCAIAVDLLKSFGKRVDYTCIKQIDSVTVDSIRQYLGRTLVLTDFGSGQHSLLEEHGIKDYYVIDHHSPERPYERQINPHDFGIDGGRHISGAGMSYLVAKSLGRTKMAAIAIVGAVGDMQDSLGALEGINRIILDDAVEQKLILVENDLRMFGRSSRSLAQMLAYSSEPIIPGLTADQMMCAQFIEGNGIRLKEGDEWRSYVELSKKERENFFSALYIRMIDANIPDYKIDRMFGEVYTLVQEPFKSELADAKEYATVLNACGRQRQPNIGVEVCLGERGMICGQAQSLLESHRRQLRSGIELLSDKGCDKMDNLNYFDAGDDIDESIIGVVAGMAYGAQIIPSNKPILAFAQDRDDEGFYKVSARANWDLVRSGLDLGKAMRKCSKLLGGEGGGHNIAAGARFPKEKRKEFLELVDREFADQLG